MQVKIQMQPKDIETLLKQIIIVIDSREKENKHITDFFKARGINWTQEKLDFGDYGYRLEGVDLVYPRWVFSDLYIERKASLVELSNNLSQDRDRFELELDEICKRGGKLNLLIEDSNAMKNIFNNDYGTNLNKEAFLGSLFSFIHKYNISIAQLPKYQIGEYIYLLCKYHLREALKF